MSKITIDIDAEIADRILVKEMIHTWTSLKNDLGAGNNVFAWGDQEQDDAEIQKHINALELLLKWYATPDQLRAIGLEP